MELTKALPEASERPPVSTPSQTACHKELQFDARYGWTYDKFFDPVELATCEGRGRFALFPILAASVHLSVAMVAHFEEASCSYTVRGAKYARKAATSARKGLARRSQRLVPPLRPRHAVRVAPKQGLRRPQKALLSPALESGQRVALQFGRTRLEGTEVEEVQGSEEVSGASRPDSGARTEGAAVSSASETVLIGESAASETVTAERGTLAQANEVESASAKVEEFGGAAEASGREGAPVDEEPGVSADRPAVREQHPGASPDRSAAAEARETVREPAREERREGEALGDGLIEDADEEHLSGGLGSDVRATSLVGESDGTRVVIETARGPRRQEAAEPRAEERIEGDTELMSSGLDTKGVPSSTRDVSNLGPGGAVEIESAARGSAEVDASSLGRGIESAINEGASLDEAHFERKSEEEGEGPAREIGRVEAVVHSTRTSKDKGVDTSEGRPRATIWRAPDDLPKGSQKPLYVVEAERFRRGYREAWNQGRKMLEVEKRRLQSQLGKRMSGSKALHRFLREEFGETTAMSAKC